MLHKITSVISLFILFFYCLIIIKSCQSSDSVKMKERIIYQGKSKDSALFQMIDSPLYKFGDIALGEKITYAFHFSNSGSGPLIIYRVSASCGCTVAKFPETPIQADKKDSIIVFYDSNLSGKGIQNKVITVFSNSPNSPYLLTLVGNVK